MNLFRSEEEILEGVRLRGMYNTKREANEEIARLVKNGYHQQANHIKEYYPWMTVPSGYEYVEIKHCEELFHPSKWNMKR